MSAMNEPRTITIKPSTGWAALNLKDLWDYRELIYFFTWRDLKVRYKQTLLGASWAVLQPVLTMVVFSIFFGGLAKVPSDGVPYPIFSYTALLPWTLFSKALQDASRSLVSSANIISKVYFPRLILPISSTLAGLVDFAIAFVVLLLMMVFYGIHPIANLWLLPLLILLALITAIGVSLWLSALNVMYRDVGHMLPFLNQFWMYITPIAYSSSIVPEKWRFVYALNPLTGVVEGFRWALLGTGEGPGITLLISSCIAILITISGLFYFRRMERKFADLV